MKPLAEACRNHAKAFTSSFFILFPSRYSQPKLCWASMTPASADSFKYLWKRLIFPSSRYLDKSWYTVDSFWSNREGRPLLPQRHRTPSAPHHPSAHIPRSWISLQGRKGLRIDFNWVIFRSRRQPVSPFISFSFCPFQSQPRWRVASRPGTSKYIDTHDWGCIFYSASLLIISVERSNSFFFPFLKASILRKKYLFISTVLEIFNLTFFLLSFCLVLCYFE